MAVKHNLITGAPSAPSNIKHSLSESADQAPKYTFVPNPLGPEFKNTDRRVWEAKVYRNIKQLLLYQSAITTNPAILSLVNDSQSSTQAGSTSQTNTAWDGGDKPLKFVAGVESSGDLTFTNSSSGLTLSVDTGSGIKSYRLKLRWNSAVSRASMHLEEI